MPRLPTFPVRRKMRVPSFGGEAPKVLESSQKSLIGEVQEANRPRVRGVTESSHCRQAALSSNLDDVVFVAQHLLSHTCSATAVAHPRK